MQESFFFFFDKLAKCFKLNNRNYASTQTSSEGIIVLFSVAIFITYFCIPRETFFLQYLVFLENFIC